MAKVWKKLQRADGDFTGTIDGTAASTVKSGASAGTSAKTITDAAFDSSVKLKTANAQDGMINSNTTASDVGLGNVTNESKADMFASPTFTGTVGGVTSTHVGLGNVANQRQTETFRQDGIPTATAVGDMWIDTNDDNKQYRAAAVGSNEIKSGEWEAITPAKGAVGLGNVVNESPSDLKATMSLDNVDNNSTATILGGTLTGAVSNSATVGGTAASTVASGAADGATAKGITDSAFTDDSGTPKLNVANANNALKNDQISLSASGGTVTLSGASSSNNTFTKSSIGLASVEDKSMATILAGDLTGKVDGTDVSTIKSGASAGTNAKVVTDAAFDSSNKLNVANAADGLKNNQITLTASGGTVTMNNAGGGSFGKTEVGLDKVVNQKVAVVSGKIQLDDTDQTLDADTVGGDSKDTIKSAAVTTAESNILDGAPPGLTTLNELAAALGDNATFSTTMTNNLATKGPAPLTLTAEDVDGDNTYSSAANTPSNLSEGQVGIYNGEQYVIIDAS